MNNHYTKEILEAAINASETWAEVARRLGVKASTGGQSYIKARAISFGLEATHFRGRAWWRGKENPLVRKPLEPFLVEHSRIGSHRLKMRLFREGYKEQKCEKCGIAKWMDAELPLELDHINSVHDDCRLDNLQILCPNCHAVKTRNTRRPSSPTGRGV